MSAGLRPGRKIEVGEIAGVREADRDGEPREAERRDPERRAAPKTRENAGDQDVEEGKQRQQVTDPELCAVGADQGGAQRDERDQECCQFASGQALFRKEAPRERDSSE